MNPLLVRQLKRLGVVAEKAPDDAAWSAILERVSAAYDQSDQDRYTLERALEVSSEELNEAMLCARAASRAKTLFLANMSHEIRTPMTAIVGYADLLMGPDCPNSVEAIEGIRRNGDHLLGVINDILDIARIEDGKVTVERRPCSPAQIVIDAVALLRPKAAEKGLPLMVETDPALPPQILADPMRLRQIIINLVGNAIKFTASGHVRIVVQLGPAQPPSLQIVVEDTGIGLHTDQVDKLFTPFVQADESMARRFGGSGLGLSISRALARLMGGDMSVRSEFGTGSTFTLAIPVELPCVEASVEPGNERPIASVPTMAVPLTGRRILLVEDGLDNQRIIGHHLRKAGAELSIAINGSLAVDAVTAAAAPFHLILMDMQMPVMDGYAATSRLRSMGVCTPIVALTAHAMEGDRQKCRDAGCDEYLTKPITRDRLIATVEEHITNSLSEKLAA